MTFRRRPRDNGGSPVTARRSLTAPPGREKPQGFYVTSFGLRVAAAQDRERPAAGGLAHRAARDPPQGKRGGRSEPRLQDARRGIADGGNAPRCPWRMQRGWPTGARMIASRFPPRRRPEVADRVPGRGRRSTRHPGDASPAFTSRQTGSASRSGTRPARGLGPRDRRSRGSQEDSFSRWPTAIRRRGYLRTGVPRARISGSTRVRRRRESGDIRRLDLRSAPRPHASRNPRRDDRRIPRRKDPLRGRDVARQTALWARG